MQAVASLNEFIYLRVVEAIMEDIDIYLRNAKNPEQSVIRSMVAHATEYLPFTTMPEKPLAFKDLVGPETENDWEE